MAELDKEVRQNLIHDHMERFPWARDLRRNRIRQQVLHSLARLVIIGVLLFLAGTFGVIPCPVWLRVVLYILAALELITAVMRLQMAINWGYQDSIIRMLDSRHRWAGDILETLRDMPRLKEPVHGLYMDDQYIFFSGDLFDVAMHCEDLVWAYPNKVSPFIPLPRRSCVTLCSCYGEQRNMYLPKDEITELLNYLRENLFIPIEYHPSLSALLEKDSFNFFKKWEGVLAEAQAKEEAKKHKK